MDFALCQIFSVNGWDGPWEVWRGDIDKTFNWGSWKNRGRAGHVGYLVNRIGRIYLAVMQDSNRCKHLLDKGVELSIHGLMTGLGARVLMRVKNGTVLCQMYLCWPQTWNSQLWGKAVGSLFKTKHCGCWGPNQGLPTRSPG